MTLHTRQQRMAGRFTSAATTLTTCVALLLALPRGLHAQWSTTYEQFYLQASHNWQFRTHYSHADRLFNAFDFGHAILYETLWRFPNAPASELEERRYDQLTLKVLVKPPRIPLEETAIEPMYARLAPEAKVMFDWAHLLHRQLYDVLSDERMLWPAKDAEVARLIAYYKSRPELAFSSKPKTMALMQEQPFSLAFRKKYPKFNGLIWGYHWLQMGLYEPFMVGTTVAQKQALVRATVARFFQMLEDVPRSLPHQMPMTVAVAPKFAERYPEAAIIFDNLHSMHDVISDILTNPSIPRDRKRAQIMVTARQYRDDTTEVMSVPAWRTMSNHMGIENMGGPAVGFVTALPTPSVSYGAVMRHDAATGDMIGFGYGTAVGSGASATAHDAHAGHVMTPTPNAADVAFMQGMLVHHAQALTMADLVATRSSLPALAVLTERLVVSQRDEMAVMRTWLEARQQTVPMAADPAHQGHVMPGDSTARPMSGMLSPAQLDSLRAARGTVFDQLFLQYMIMHHEGALAMVAALLKTPGAAQDPQVFQMVSDIDTDQRAEIRRLQALRDAR